MSQYGPSPVGGAYCHKVLGSDGNIVGFECTAHPTGRVDEGFYSGARVGSWGPSGPFWPVEPPPSQQAPATPGGGSQSGQSASQDWANRQNTGPKPSQQAPAVPPSESSKAKVVTGPDGENACGSAMAVVSDNSFLLKFKYAPDDYLKAPNIGHFYPVPVFGSFGPNSAATGAWGQNPVSYGFTPRVEKNDDGQYTVIYSGTSPGSVIFSPPELQDYHAYGDGVLNGAKWPGKISGHSMLFLSGQRSNAAHGGNPDAYISIGLAYQTSRKPKSGWYGALLSTGEFAWLPTNATAATDATSRRWSIGGVVIPSSVAYPPVGANPNSGGDAATTLWSNSGVSNRPYWGSSRIALYTEIPSVITDHGALTGLSDDDHTQYMLNALTATDNNLVQFNSASGRNVDDSGIPTADVVTAPVAAGADNRIAISVGATKVVEFAAATLSPTGDAAFSSVSVGARLIYSVDSPAQITSNQDNYALAATVKHRLDSDAVRDITGVSVSGWTNGEAHELINTGANAIVLKHNSGSSTVPFYSPTALDYTINPGQSAWIQYDSTSSVVRITSGTGA